MGVRQPGGSWLPSDRAQPFRSMSGGGSLVLLACAFVLTMIGLRLLAGPWVLGIAALVGALICLFVALYDVLGLPFLALQDAPMALPSGGSRALGIGALTVAAGMAAVASLRLAGDPTIGGILLLYPLALAVGWCGEGWLLGRTVGVRMAALQASLFKRRTEIAWIAALTLAGTVVRFWMADSYFLQHGTVSDELLVGAGAWSLAHSTGAWPLYATMGGAVALFQPVAAAFLIFGTSLGTLRGVAVVESMALVPSFYLLVRQFVDPRAALCTSALLSFGFWAAMMSTLAFGWTIGAAFQSLGLALIVYGLRRDRLVSCATGGAVLALCFYSYLGHRIMPLPGAVVVLAFLLRGHATLERRITLVLATAFGFVVVALPWLHVVAGNSELFYGDSRFVTDRFQQELHHNPLSALGDALSGGGHLGGTLLVGPQSSDFSVLVLPSGGVLDMVSAALAVLGLALVLAHPLRDGSLLILCGILVPLAIASMALDFVDVYRINGVLPALYLAMALPLDRGRVLVAHRPAIARWTTAALVVIACAGAVSGVHTATDQLSSCSVALGNAGPLDNDDGEPVQLAEAANAQSMRQAIFIVSKPHHFPIDGTVWLYRRVPIVIDPSAGGSDPARWPFLYGVQVQGSSGAHFWPPRVAPGQTGITYMMADDAANTFLPLLQRAYPGGITTVITSKRCAGGFTITAYALRARQLAPVSGR